MNQKGVYLRLSGGMIANLDQRAEKMGVPRASIIKQILYDATKEQKVQP